MLSFDIRSLVEHAVTVDDVLSPNDAVWTDADAKPSEPILVKGRLSSAGPGRFYWHGWIEGDLGLPCRRCLGAAAGHVSAEAHLIFAEAGSDDVEHDPDVFVLDDRMAQLDLRPALREQWLLNAPGYALCQNECRGLCLSCGADLNVDPCSCASSGADPRWAGLHEIKSEPG